MKIIHVMMQEKFTTGMVKFFNDYFDNGEHKIVYCNTIGEKSLIDPECKIEQVDIYREDNMYLIKSLEKMEGDYIILHNLFFLTNPEKLDILLHPKMRKKIVWVEWGADLYSWKSFGGIKTKLLNVLNYLFRCKIKHVIFIFPPDEDFYKQEFKNSKAKCYYAPYLIYPLSKEYDKYVSESRLAVDKIQGNPIYIQIGHNGMPTLNHKRVLKELSKYGNENINILLPLSYGGTKEYVDDVAEYANKLFPGKTTILRDFMPADEYYQLLKKVSIVIFDTHRQCALGNIHLMNFRNVKLYLSAECVMYNYFLEQGVPVEKCENIKDMSFEEFIACPQIVNKDKFRSYIDSISHIDFGKSCWENIFEELRFEMQ